VSAAASRRHDTRAADGSAAIDAQIRWRSGAPAPRCQGGWSVADLRVMDALAPSPLPSTPLDTELVELSSHALVRYRERVKPALAFEAASRELFALLAVGEHVCEAPSWLAAKQRTVAEAYLVIGDDLVLPLARTASGWIAKTCIARGGISSRARECRNRARRADGRRRRD
jgi:hypothetical protein